MERIKRIKVSSNISESLLGIEEDTYSPDMVYINYGTIRNTNEGVVYLANDGKRCLFPEVKFKLSEKLGYRAYQMRGVIHVGSQWIGGNFKIDDFTHEFGHFLQEKEYGHFIYFFKIAVPSFCACGFLTGDERENLKIEKDASDRGKAFLDDNLR